MTRPDAHAERGGSAVTKRLLDEDYVEPPMADEQPPPEDAGARKSRLAALIGALGNLSIQYNFGALSPAVAIMMSHADIPIPKPNPDGLTPDVPEPVGGSCGRAQLTYARLNSGCVG
jgi:hypothetical protein